jgi:hypothetical protein
MDAGIQNEVPQPTDMSGLWSTPKIPVAVEEGADGQQQIVVKYISRREYGTKWWTGEPLQQTVIASKTASNLVS